MGVVECLNHKLVEPFSVLYEKEGRYMCVHVYATPYTMLLFDLTITLFMCFYLVYRYMYISVQGSLLLNSNSQFY